MSARHIVGVREQLEEVRHGVGEGVSRD
jgi:hypothetical protein